MLDTVVALELPSTLGPPFTIAVAIVETGQDWSPDGQPPDRERETAEMCMCWVSRRYQNRGEKRCRKSEMVRKTTGAN